MWMKYCSSPSLFIRLFIYFAGVLRDERMRLKKRLFLQFPMIDCSQALGSWNYDSYSEIIHLILFSARSAFNTHMLQFVS